MKKRSLEERVAAIEDYIRRRTEWEQKKWDDRWMNAITGTIEVDVWPDGWKRQ